MRRVLRRIVHVEDAEISATLWACAYFFFLLSSWYILRPLRDEISAAEAHYDVLPYLWDGTFLAMIVAVWAYTVLVSRVPRRVFVPVVYLFFAANILVFHVALQMSAASARVWIERCFYVWSSVYSLFVVSVFWSFMADIFRSAQGKRLFGFVAVGGSIGGLCGSGMTALLAEPLEPVNLLLIAVVLLLLAVLCASRVGHVIRAAPDQPVSLTLAEVPRPSTESRDPAGASPAREADQPIRGGILIGLNSVVRSPYLLGICVFLVLLSLSSTVLYLVKAEIAGSAFDDRAVRTAFYARVDFLSLCLTLAVQLFLTGRVITRLGVSATLITLPVIAATGFLCLAVAPVLWMLVLFEVVQRTGRYALAKPAREVLFTVVGRAEKYKSKAFLDTVALRGGDVANMHLFKGLQGLGISIAGLALAALGPMAVWMLIAWALGRMHDRRAVQVAEKPVAGSTARPR